MKNEQKRYTLVEYGGTYTVNYDTREKLDEALDRIRKYNNREKEPHFFGNMNVIETKDGFELTTHIYHKLSKKCTISSLDSATSKYNEEELIFRLKERIRSVYPEFAKDSKPFYPDINIAYFEDKNESDRDENLIRRIKYIPVLYKDDLKYIDENKVRNMLKEYANESNLDFFEKLVHEYNPNRSVDNELDELERAIDRVRNLGYGKNDLYIAASNLYSALIFERNKNKECIYDSNGYKQRSRRRLRDFGFFIKEYETRKYKSTMKYNYIDNKEKIEKLKEIREELIRINASNKESELKLKKKNIKK